MPTMRVRDVDLYYEVTGEGQPLLFIHGLGSSGRDWELQMAAFSDRYHVITFDLRGHGRSNKPPGPYTVPMFAADTTELMKALGIAPAHVVGLSLGGAVAFQLAVDVPEVVRSLVVVNFGPELVLRTFKERLALWQRHAIVRLIGMRKMGEILSKHLFPKPEHEEIRLVFVGRWAENDKRAYLDALRSVVGWSVVERLGTIQCPTLLIAADQDYTPVSVKEACVAQIPHAELVVIPDSRHATPMEQPEKFNAALMEFLLAVETLSSVVRIDA